MNWYKLTVPNPPLHYSKFFLLMSSVSHCASLCSGLDLTLYTVFWFWVLSCLLGFILYHNDLNPLCFHCSHVWYKCCIIHKN